MRFGGGGFGFDDARERVAERVAEGRRRERERRDAMTFGQVQKLGTVLVVDSTEATESGRAE